MLKRSITLTLSIFTILLLITAANAQRRVLFGQVVDVLDGKTVVVQGTSGKINVELQFIDVPVAGEPMAEVVREHLRTLVQGKHIEYRIRNIQSDRTVGRLTVSAVDVSQQMLRDGAAWLVPSNLSGQDSNDFQLYATTEAAARDEKRGVWSMPDLKPSWERTSANQNAQTQQTAPVASTSSVLKLRGTWGDKNPRLGNIGPLINGYNAASRLGYLSTSFVGIQMVDGHTFDGDLALDITYYYKEGEGKAPRKGIYVFTIASRSRSMQFLKDNDLVATFGEKKVNLGRPQRSATNDGMYDQEILKYRISREMLQKLVNTDDAYLKLGKNAIYLAQVKYLLYNMLQLAD
jgi:endonuclease YncB( thermonuclease family)